MCIGCQVVEPITAKTKSSIKKNSVRVKWHKTDMDYYKALVTEKIEEMSSEFVLDYTCNLESAILGFTEILINSTHQTTKTSRRRSRKRKLKVWTREISDVLQQLRNLNKKIDAMNNFNINEKQLLQERKYLKKEFRRACRVEVAKRTENDKNHTMAYNSKTFNQLVKKQRNKGNSFISNLYVGNEKYTGTWRILDGFQQHFEKLALSKEDVNFDAEYHKLNKYESKLVLLLKLLKTVTYPM